MTYYVMEVMNINSYSEAEKIEAKNLTAAKRTASRQKCFMGTVLYIGDKVNADGFILDPICYKKDGVWHDC